MTETAIIFIDANTIWHRRLAEALGTVRPTVAILPTADVKLRCDPYVAPAEQTVFMRMGLPPGWGNRTSAFGQRLLAGRVRRLAKELGDCVVVLSSPAYAPLSAYLKDELPIVSYTADDYHSYAGWANVGPREASIFEAAALRVFVSEALRERACRTHGFDIGTTWVSPNGTEPRFGPDGMADRIPLDKLGLARPVLGILGGLSDRLDLDVVRQAASLPTVGTLLIAGPVSDALRADATWLADPRIHVTGRLPHDSMHRYAHAMDAALIPYAPGDLNHFCSPMRLFDHLASGAGVYALPTCDQVTSETSPGVFVGPAEAILDEMSSGLDAARFDRTVADFFWRSRATHLVTAIEHPQTIWSTSKQGQ